MPYTSETVTPDAVAACARVAALPYQAEVMRDALALLPTLAARHLDADEVSSVAAILLGGLIESGYAARDAARMAVVMAGKRSAPSPKAVKAGKAGKATPVGDWEALSDVLPASFGGAPDGIARWADSDTLEAILSAVPMRDRVLLTSILTFPTVTAYAHKAIESGEDDATVWRHIARAMKSARKAARDIVREVGTVPTGKGDAPVMCGGSTPLPTSGPASYVIDWAPDGTPWLALPSASHLVSHAAAERYLAWPHALKADGSATRGEEETVALMASTDITTRGAARHQGVTTGIVYGVGRIIAGTGAPTPKPSPARKRSRDGAVGASMIPA